MSLRSVRDVATEEVVTSGPDVDARTLAQTMRNEQVGSIVIHESGYPIGIVTDRDLAIRVLADRTEGPGSPARGLMTEYPTTVRDDLDVYDAARTLDEHGVRRLPVVDGGDQLVGIVSLDDIFTDLVKEQGHLARVIAAESPS